MSYVRVMVEGGGLESILRKLKGEGGQNIA